MFHAGIYSSLIHVQSSIKLESWVSADTAKKNNKWKKQIVEQDGFHGNSYWKYKL